ncbi:MAG: 5-formyltetrahydrofolate cyclo-ligase [Chlamydiia bacterium]|nr:5-formyltetrahydrofolate cyclo-ligase [Chlamydiia bacterium]MCP5509428.1 5-formyltetrahydrofolate cyclo-ligase [Chlamydiales bacterium]
MNKPYLRKIYKLRRMEISKDRRLEAKKSLLETLVPLLSPFKKILSFASTQYEIDLWPLNALLAKDQRLCLPRLENHQINPYYVPEIDGHLLQSPYHVLEPDPKLCSPIAKSNLDCILVPGLCFDQNNHRLGYGLGHFDRFLKDVLTTPIFGIGFKEQFIPKLPSEPHDMTLTNLYLF